MGNDPGRHSAAPLDSCTRRFGEGSLTDTPWLLVAGAMLAPTPSDGDQSRNFTP